MTLTELRYIVAVAREKHFGRAAEKCFVSQPTLSVAIKKLEDELGVPLFERAASEVRLTAVGTRVIEQAQRVLEEASAIKQIAAAGKDELVMTAAMIRPAGAPLSADQAALCHAIQGLKRGAGHYDGVIPRDTRS